MSKRRVLVYAAALVTFIAGPVAAQHVVPSALLTIDQNRATVVDRIVNQWGDPLLRSNAGITPVQLREILGGLRADHLLAASLAGSVEGLRDVVSGALVRTDAAISPAFMQTKSLGDTGIDLVYTPIAPCRILDTRNGTASPYNAPMMGGSAFPVAASLSNFAAQGGSASNCNLPPSSSPIAAVAVTLTVLNPNFDAFLVAGSSNNFSTLTQAVVMDFSANKGLANTAIVPVDGMVKFYLALPAGVTTNVIADAAGYLRRPANYGGNTVITGNFGTVNGGFGNKTSGDYGVVAGGNSNIASNFNAAVGGGYGNTASGSGATVAGGGANIASGSSATVGGGSLDTASGDGSSVGGGSGNNASGQYGAIAGGNINTASSLSAAVAGGDSNVASGAFSAIAGGSNNVASNFYSTVAGGNNNTASGFFSFAAGYHANANHNGCFVWGDSSSPYEVNCSGGIDEVVMRALGGFYFYTAGDGMNQPYSGAQLPIGASAWSVFSDRAGKENVHQVNVRAVLRKVAAMPIGTWNWKTQAPSIRHMGPMAQDFHAAFGLGETPKGISTVDADGVAFAAIQGLHQMMKQKDARLQKQETRIAALERELAMIKKKLGID